MSNLARCQCQTCRGTGLIRGEPRGHDEQGRPLFVIWQCDCQAREDRRLPDIRPCDPHAGSPTTEHTG